MRLPQQLGSCRLPRPVKAPHQRYAFALRLVVVAVGLVMAMGTPHAAAQQPRAALTVTAYLDSALDVIQQNALRRGHVDWMRVRRVAHERAAGAGSTIDTYDAIRFALRELNDGHSFLQLPDSLAELERRAYPDRSTQTRASAKPTSPFANRRQPSSMVHRSGGRSFGRVVIPAFGGQGPRISAFADTLQEMLQRLAAAQPCGWIVDLRGNGGGNMWPMLAGVGPLLGETEDAGRFRSLDGDVRWYYGRGAAGTIAGDGAREEAARISGTPLPALRGAVAVLTDRGTASSGEALAIAFRGRSDTRSFGEATYGVPTANQGFRLSDGANIVLTVAIEVDRTGQEFDREIVPDEPIAAEGQPDRPEQDPVITRAISWLAATPDCRR